MNAGIFEVFKEQLYSFIECADDPLDTRTIFLSCNIPINWNTLIEALYLLEEEGKIIRLQDGRYTTARSAAKKWIKKLYHEIEIPEETYLQMKQLITLGFYRTITEIIRDAIKLYKSYSII